LQVDAKVGEVADVGPEVMGEAPGVAEVRGGREEVEEFGGGAAVGATLVDQSTGGLDGGVGRGCRVEGLVHFVLGIAECGGGGDGPGEGVGASAGDGRDFREAAESSAEGGAEGGEDAGESRHESGQ
jgi:hypothetical protein